MSRRPSPPSDREPEIARGHELGLPEGSRPRARKLVGRNVAAIDDLQRRHQLGAEIARPLAVAGERRERLHQRPLAHRRAEIRLDPPNRRQHVPADAVSLFRVSERLGVFGHRRLAVRNPLLVDEALDIVPDRRLELRLLFLEFEHLHVGLKPIEGLVEGAGETPERAPSARSDATQEEKSARAGAGWTTPPAGGGAQEKAMRFMGPSSTIRVSQSSAPLSSRLS